jgi:hypothetical protein
MLQRPANRWAFGNVSLHDGQNKEGRVTFRFWGVGLLALCVTSFVGDRQIRLSAATIPIDPDPTGVTVHEWGTFTTVAGEDGQAVQWLPLGGPTDLPCFVHYFDNRQIKLGPAQGTLLTYQTLRDGLRGTVRMETPVLYFYAERPATVDVTVKFQRGLFTEWYPAAGVGQLYAYQNLFTEKPDAEATIAWKDVHVLPGASPQFRVEPSPSHYYAARGTDAAPVQVKGSDEKFLFYRGVAGFAPPISAKLEKNGTITVSNRAGAGTEIPRIILFTKQGGRFGYRMHDALKAQTAGPAQAAQTVLDPPSPNGTFEALRQELERTLVAQGLYAKEAKAMVDTWRDSWFEDGTRVFYIVPRATIDAVLPLKIEPAPSAVVRVFVGRMDLIAPADVTAVKKALETRNRPTLERYGRLLGPIADRILASTPSPEQRAGITTQLDDVLKSYATRVGHCDVPSPSPSPATDQGPLALIPHGGH